MAWLSRSALEEMGFESIGPTVFISDKASFYNCQGISIGNHVRIDDFCVISAGSGGIEIGNYVHVAVFSSLVGRGKITLSDYCNISSRVAVFSSSDDYSGGSMTNPLIPEQYKQVLHADVQLGKHVIIGCGSVILPGVSIGDGAAVGALSLIQKNCQSFGIYAGVPARLVKERKRKLLELEQQFVATHEIKGN
jgi:dTDP-4-amino-4,6-dideoxy-D-glucose acyltransferase